MSNRRLPRKRFSVLVEPIGYDEVKLRLGGIRHLLQGWLFPQLEENIGELDEKDRLVVEVMAMFDAAPLLALPQS